MRRFSGLLAAAITTVSMQAHAGEKLCDPYDRASCVQAVHRGESAPFSGHLLTPRRTGVLAQALEDCRNWTARDKPGQGFDDTCLGQQTVWRLLLESERYERKQAEEILMRRLDVAVEKAPKWYESPWFVAATSIVGTAGVLMIFR